MSLFSLQGKIYLGDRLANGKLGKPVWVGNAPSCQLKLSTETSNKTESFSGHRLQYGRLQKSKTAELSLTLDEWLPQNLALGLYATPLSVAAGSVTGEVLPDSIAAGDLIKLDRSFVTSVAITDSAATPATLPDSHWMMASASAGLLQFMEVEGYTQPFRAAYRYAQGQALTIFTAQPPERYLLLDGLNTETGDAIIVRLYRVRFDPAGQLDLITDDYGNLPLTGSVLYDVVNAADDSLGGFGTIEQKGNDHGA